MSVVGRLTEREREVCRRLAAGQRPQEIAMALALKVGSVYRYMLTIREKLEVEHTLALVAKVRDGADLRSEMTPTWGRGSSGIGGGGQGMT